MPGQLFHGDFTNLFLMDAGSAALVTYSRSVEEAVRPLAPFLIYFYQDDVERAIRAIAAQRGQEWVSYQVDWKLKSPYSRRLGLSGLEGLIALYRDYRALTDELYAGSAWRSWPSRIRPRPGQPTTNESSVTCWGGNEPVGLALVGAPATRTPHGGKPNVVDRNTFTSRTARPWASA